jgi:hypothetical protein
MQSLLTNALQEVKIRVAAALTAVQLRAKDSVRTHHDGDLRAAEVMSQHCG